MSDGKGWVGTPERERIRGLMARSANVIAAAHEDLDKSSDDIECLANEPGAKKRRRRPKFPTVPTLTKSPLEPSSKRRPSKVKSWLTNEAETSSGSDSETSTGRVLPQDGAQPKDVSQTKDLELFQDSGRSEDAALPAAPPPPLEPVDKRETASAHRRAVFRQFLRTRDIGDVRSLERLRREGAEDAAAVEIGPGQVEDGTGEIKGWRRRLRQRRLRHAAAGDRQAFEPSRDDRSQDGLDRDGLDRVNPDRADRDDAPYDLKREAPWNGARFTHEPWEKRVEEEESKPHSLRSSFLSWNRRLDALTNTIAGLLIVTLLAVSVFGTGRPDRPNTGGANAATVPQAPGKAEQAPGEAGIPAPRMSVPDRPVFPAARGFDIHERAFPKPLPEKPADISAMLFWSHPSRSSAPGLAVIPYADLPLALPSMPRDVEGHIFMSTPQP